MPPSWLRPARTWSTGRGGRDARHRAHHDRRRRAGERPRTGWVEPVSRYAPELVEGGFAVEVADAPLLHDGLNVADVAHVLVLRERGVIPEDAASKLLGVLRDAVATPWTEF